jgi:hypothetical protein
LERVGRYLRHYAQFALANGVAFVPQFMAFDLGVMVTHAFEQNSPAAPVLLSDLLSLKHLAGVEPLPLIVKAKAVVGGSLLEAGRDADAERVRVNLADVPQATLQQAEQDLMTLDDRSFWEVTDRQVNFEWVPPERRAGVRKFFALLRRKEAAPAAASSSPLPSGERGEARPLDPARDVGDNPLRCSGEPDGRPGGPGAR